ncbi:Lectin-domain containing receptor kinase A4.3 [Hordeum vulgare]|nr:Lectin-domain containing receptor kinase A4.3 [Hordeum vulgare]
MDDDLDLDAAAGLASLASSDKGKPRASRKAAAPKPKKVLTTEQRAKESAKRKDRRHATSAMDEAIAAAPAQQQVTNVRVAAATREALCMLGLNPSQHDLVNATVAAAVSTGPSAFPRTLLPDSPRASACNPVPSFHVYPQAPRLSGGVLARGECGRAYHAHAHDHRPQRHTGGRWLVIRRRKETRAADANGPAVGRAQPAQRNAGHRRRRLHAEHDLQGWCAGRWLRSQRAKNQDGRGYNEDQAAFMHDQVGVGLDLDGFPLDHEFPEDYGLEEEDECDIEAEPLFEDELANQADETTPKRKSKRTKAHTSAEDKLLCECWRDIWQDPKTEAEQKHSTFWIRVHREFHERKKFPPYQIASARGWVSISKRWGMIQQECNKFCAILESVKARPVSGIGVQDMAFQALEAFKVQHNGKCFNLSHCLRVIKDDKKFKAQSAGLKSRDGKHAVKEVGDGEKAWPRGKTNSKKEDKWDATSIALIATEEGMITKKDSREEKRRQEREEQINVVGDPKEEA